MKQRFALFLTFLLFGMTLSPTLLAHANEPLLSADAEQKTILSDNLTNPLSMSLQITPSMLTVTSSAIILTSFDEPDRADAVAFPLGISQEELTSWFADISIGFAGYDSQWHFYDLMPKAWSLETVDTSATGVYYASAIPELGQDYVVADGISLPRQLCAVSIQKPGEPDINCFVSARGFLRFPWVLSPEQQEQFDAFAVWMRQDSGEWTPLSEGFWFASDYFQLSQRILEEGSTYDLRVTYPGGQTGVLTFEYDGELRIIDYSRGDRDGGDVNAGGLGAGSQLPPNSPQPPNDFHDSDSSNNDTNTNTDSSSPIQDISSLSSNETPPESVITPKESPTELMLVFNEPVAKPIPTFIEPQKSHNLLLDKVHPEQTSVADQPSFITLTAAIESAPAPSSPASSPKSENVSATQHIQNPVVLESYSPLHTVISGLRLRDLCTDEKSVVFGSDDITVSIPSKLLMALNLSDSDFLSVKLTQPQNNQVMLMVEANGKSVSALSGTILRLRYMPLTKNAEITVKNLSGEQLSDATFDGEFLRFPANATGTYNILETPKAIETQKSLLPILLLSVGSILLTGGILLFRRKYHG